MTDIQIGSYSRPKSEKPDSPLLPAIDDLIKHEATLAEGEQAYAEGTFSTDKEQRAFLYNMQSAAKQRERGFRKVILEYTDAKGKPVTDPDAIKNDQFASVKLGGVLTKRVYRTRKEADAPEAE